MKPYHLGILVGRFQTLHLGHQSMIEQALMLCDCVGIFIGSSQESRTAKNPFSFEERRDMLLTLFPERVQVFPLPDIGAGNNTAWGDYVLQNVVHRFGCVPDLLVTGKEERRVGWFTSEMGSGIGELHVPKTISISASRLRQYVLDDDRESWQRFVDNRLWDRYPFMRKILLLSQENQETSSI